MSYEVTWRDRVAYKIANFAAKNIATREYGALLKLGYGKVFEEAMIEDSAIVTHARSELKRAGLFDSDSDYDGRLGVAVMELVHVFARQRHSGYSAGAVLSLFNTVGKQEALSSLTNDPKEWIDQSAVSGYPIWQNNRDSRAMSEDGGRTYWLVDDPNKTILTSTVA